MTFRETVTINGVEAQIVTYYGTTGVAFRNEDDINKISDVMYYLAEEGWIDSHDSWKSFEIDSP